MMTGLYSSWTMGPAYFGYRFEGEELNLGFKSNYKSIIGQC